MGKIRLGSTEVKKVRMGSTAVKNVYLGSTKLWSDFIPQNMDKSGTFSTSSGSNTLVTGWTAREAGTVVSGNKLQSISAGPMIVKARAISSMGGGGTGTIVLLRNGSAIQTLTVSEGSNNVELNFSVALTGAIGDLFHLEAKSSYFAASVTVSSGYVSLTPPA